MGALARRAACWLLGRLAFNLLSPFGWIISAAPACLYRPPPPIVCAASPATCTSLARSPLAVPHVLYLQSPSCPTRADFMSLYGGWFVVGMAMQGQQQILLHLRPPEASSGGDSGGLGGGRLAAGGVKEEEPQPGRRRSRDSWGSGSDEDGGGGEWPQRGSGGGGPARAVSPGSQAPAPCGGEASGARCGASNGERGCAPSGPQGGPTQHTATCPSLAPPADSNGSSLAGGSATALFEALAAAAFQELSRTCSA